MVIIAADCGSVGSETEEELMASADARIGYVSMYTVSVTVSLMSDPI